MMKWYFIFLALLLHEAVGGVTLYVPTDYDTIQSAIDAAHQNDVILVAPGTYRENLINNGKDITIRSAHADCAPCVIDGGQAGPCATLKNTTAAMIIDGFTLTNGVGYGLPVAPVKYGCGVYAYGNGFTVRDCLFTKNIYEGHLKEMYGKSIYGRVYDYWIIEDCIFKDEDNYQPEDRSCVVYIDGKYATYYSESCRFAGNTIKGCRFNIDACVSIFSCDVILENNIFLKNKSFYGSPLYVRLGCAQYMNQYGIIRNNVFALNTCDGPMHWFFVARGGGFFVTVDWQSRAWISNNTVYGNYATYMGSGLHCSYAFGGNIQIFNNIFWKNETCHLNGDRSEIGLSYVFGGSCELDHNMVEGGKSAIVSEGKGKTTIGITFCEDPLLMDPTKGDFHLQEYSPCIDAGLMGKLWISAFDYEGQRRILAPFGPPAIIDLGADEYGQEEKTF